VNQLLTKFGDKLDTKQTTMKIKTYGFIVSPVDFTYVSNELETRGIEYDIWNAEEVFLGTAQQIEFNVATEADADVMKQILSNTSQGQFLKS
jgi:hypothetical protein